MDTRLHTFFLLNGLAYSNQGEGEGQDYAHPIMLSPPLFGTFRRAWQCELMWEVPVLCSENCLAYGAM